MPGFADLAQKVDPGVVFVRSVRRTQAGFRRVLGESKGSGFIFDPQGKILTNHHVVAGAEAVQVELKDGRTLMASLVGADPLTDLAILKVDATDLPALPLGDSDQIRVGDWVVAIGNPFGLEHTVSAGIISAKERTGRDVDLGDSEAYYSFLQTDASINPGNSGGPLLDLAGHVVGINTAINQGANNIGFAIPVNMVKRLLPRLLKDGWVRRAAIGVVVADVTSEAMELLRLEGREGALIHDVAQGGPAAQGGIRRGDVVVQFDGQPIKTPDALRWNASLAPVGAEVEISVIREGQRRELVVRPTELLAR
jgi:serine protease Do